MLIPILKLCRTLFSYLILGVVFGGICAPLLPFISKQNLPFRIWYLIDVLICTVAHNTNMRTVSGWTGQHMQNKKRYQHQAAVIDFIARLVGDKPNHCARAYKWEQTQGLTK